MYEVQESIAAQLAEANLQNSHLATATVLVGEFKVLLSSWEVTAFTKPDSDIAETLQQAVVARAIVSEAVERLKATGEALDLKLAASLGRAEVARLQ
jgi:hypothetical protein